MNKFLKKFKVTELTKLAKGKDIKDIKSYKKRDLIVVLSGLYTDENEVNTFLYENTDTIFSLLKSLPLTTLAEINFKLNGFKTVSNNVKLSKKQLVKLLDDTCSEKGLELKELKKLLSGDNDKKLNKYEKFLNKLKRTDIYVLCKKYNIIEYTHRSKSENIVVLLEYIYNTNKTIRDLKNTLFGITEEKTDENGVVDKHVHFLNTIEHVYHLADLHIRRNNRIQEYRDVFKNFINMVKDDYKNKKDKSVIVLCGDIFHYKTTQRAEGIALFTYFINELTKYHPLIIIAGNHDVDLTTNNMDIITPFEEMDNFYYLKYSGYYTFNNVVFIVSSVLDNKILKPINKNPSLKYVSLYHGTVNGCSVFNGNSLESIYNLEDFGDYDLLLLGDIHKQQYLRNRTNSAYCGSLVQQNKGESIYKHGFLLWNISDASSTFHEVQNDHCYLKVDVSKDGLIYDTDVLQNKKQLSVSYIIYESDKDKQTLMMDEFKKTIKDNGINIINEEFNKEYIFETAQDTSVVEKISHKTTDYYIKKSMMSRSDKDKINIDKIHKEIEKEIEGDENIYKTNWVLEKMEFMNIFSYGGNKKNVLDFSDSEMRGFDKIFANNFMGKTSLINIIKWALYGVSSDIMDKDILHRGKTNPEGGFVIIHFAIQDRRYRVEKHIKKSSKASGIDIEYEVYVNNILTKGKKEVEQILKGAIGSYSDFELVSSINNSDIGILKNNKCLAILQKLFKLERYEKLEGVVKEKLKEMKIKEKLTKVKLMDMEKKVVGDTDKLKEEIETIKEQMSLLTQTPYEHLEETRTQLYNKMIDIKILTEIIDDDKSDSIKILKDEVEELIKEIKEIGIKVVKEKMDKLTQDIRRLNSEKNNMFRQFTKINGEHNEEELNAQIQKIKEVEVQLTEKLTTKQELVDGYKNQINPIICEEDVINQKLETEKQRGFDYRSVKSECIQKLKESKLKLKKSDILNMLYLLENQDYSALLDDITRNDTLETQIKDETKSIKQLKMEHKKESRTLNRLEHNLSQCVENKRLKVENEKIQLKVNEYEEQLRKCEEENKGYKKIKNTYNELKDSKNSKKLKLERLQVFQEKYMEYINNKDTNEQNKKLKEDLTTQIEVLETQINKIREENTQVLLKKRGYQSEIRDLEMDCKKCEEIKEQTKMVQIEYFDMLEKVKYLTEYKSLCSSKGIPGMILQEKIPLLEKEINEILGTYVNYKICIDLVGKGVQKKLVFSQVKNVNETATKLSVNSLSGYELVILNIALKIVIKKNCYVNNPSFLCIDEVFGKISAKNYSKLKVIFDILVENYKNIMVISHINDIKEILDDYTGCYVNIQRSEEGYSYLN